MKILNFKYLIISAIALFIGINVTAQNAYILNTKNSKLIIAGTSSIHDWEMEAQNFNGETSVKVKDANSINFNKIEFNTQVSDIKSDNRIMDNKTHDALKEDKYPEISFSLKPDEAIIEAGKKSVIKGQLTIAGKTREMDVPVNLELRGDKQFQVKGEVPLKMSDFGIDPPTAMMGTLKTGNEVVIKYNLEFEKAPDSYSLNNQKQVTGN